MTTVPIKLSNFKIQRNIDYDILIFHFNAISDINEYLLIPPFDLLNVIEVKKNKNLDLEICHNGFFFFKLNYNKKPSPVNIDIYCQIKSYDTDYLNYLELKPKDEYNILMKSNIDISKTNFKEKNDFDYPYEYNFICTKKEHLEIIKSIFNEIHALRFNVSFPLKNEIYTINKVSELKLLIETISWEFNLNIQKLSFDNKSPVLQYFIFFEIKDKTFLPRLDSNIINILYDESTLSILKHNNSLHLCNLPEKTHYSLFSSNKVGLIQSYHLDEEIFFPIWTDYDDPELFLKKKYRKVNIVEGGEKQFEFFAYALNYDVRDIAEDMLFPIFKQLYEKLESKYETCLISLGVYYNPNGKLKEVKIKNTDILDSKIVNDLILDISTIKLKQQDEEYYLIYFFEIFIA